MAREHPCFPALVSRKTKQEIDIGDVKTFVLLLTSKISQ